MKCEKCKLKIPRENSFAMNVALMAMSGGIRIGGKYEALLSFKIQTIH
jgi:hypothetical protein